VSSADTPVLFKLTPVTVTGDDVPLLNVKWAKSATDCPATNVAVVGLSLDNATENPPVTVVVVPVVVVVVVVVPVVVVVVPAAIKALAFALEAVAKLPVPAVKPYGVKTSEAYLFWNFITAALVAVPK
jgi:hypothetical protein